MALDLKSKVVVNSEGWVWPKDDGDGNYEGDGSCWHYMKEHPNTPQLVAAHVPQKRIVVQAGGNAGYYVKQYASLFDCVYSFEPDPVNFYCLNINVNESNVLKFQACLGNNRGCVGLNKTTPDTGSTHVEGIGLIPTFKIDDLALQVCDLIHLDIEGYELFALQGAEETIKKHKPVLAFEYHHQWAQRYQTDLGQIEGYISTLGYKSKDFAQGDRIFVHESM